MRARGGNSVGTQRNQHRAPSWVAGQLSRLEGPIPRAGRHSTCEEPPRATSGVGLQSGCEWLQWPGVGNCQGNGSRRGCGIRGRPEAAWRGESGWGERSRNSRRVKWTTPVVFGGGRGLYVRKGAETGRGVRRFEDRGRRRISRIRVQEWYIGLRGISEAGE